MIKLNEATKAATVTSTGIDYLVELGGRCARIECGRTDGYAVYYEGEIESSGIRSFNEAVNYAVSLMEYHWL